jgi:hypothetical protein
MVVKFWTRTDQLVMHGEPAVALLRLGGHTGTVPGAVLAAEVPAFRDRIRQGLDVHGDEVLPPAPAPEPVTRGREDEVRREPVVNLRLRAVPLLDMLDRAVAHPSDVMWDKT